MATQRTNATQIGYVKAEKSNFNDPHGGAGRQVQFAAVNAAKNDSRTLVAAVSGKKIRILGGKLHGTAADGTVTFVEDAAGTPAALSGVIPLFIAVTGGLAKEAGVLDLDGCPYGCMETATAGVDFGVTLSANLDLDGYLVYCYVD